MPIDEEKTRDGDQPSLPSRLLRKLPFLSAPPPPPPPPQSLDDAADIPEATANILSLTTFGWITPLLSLGYARPLEAPDLYKLQPDRSAAYIAERINTSFDAQRKHAAEYNEKLANGQINPSWLKRTVWSIRGDATAREAKWRLDSKKRASLTTAINDSVKWWFWTGGVFKVVGDTAQVTSPLVVKAIINFATESYVGHRTGAPIPHVGRGIGLTFVLLALQEIGSLCTHHFFYRATSTGVLLRGGLITAIYTRSLRLTNRARSTLTNGKLVNHISTDVSRIDFCAGFFHMAWAAPIQMLICLALLLTNLGPSALAGFGFFLLMTPLQTFVMKRLFSLRAKSMVWTDKRAKLLQELLGGMKIIKFFAWENPFLKRISGYRASEMGYIRTLLLFRSGNNAVAMSMPVLASVLAFVTYSLTGHSLNPADIFTSLTLFNLLRLPLMFLPMAFSSIADASNAVRRLQEVFEAELFDEAGTLLVDEHIHPALEVKGAEFSWDAPPPQEESKATRKHHMGKTNRPPVAKKSQPKVQEGTQEEKKEAEPFKVRDLNLTIKRGQLVAIVGPVGSGKTSLLQGIIGEMRRTSGTVKVGARVGYCAQSAWIQNATIRENICFGRPFEEARYWSAVKGACLEPDLAILPYGDLTEVGERGISLSGGQKQRLNICRTLYSDADIQIYDDPLSALDAHVGKAVFSNVLLGNPDKTRILVTHALHFLPQVDYIYVVADGCIVEQGTYEGLLQTEEGAFSRFIKEFGGKEEEEESKQEKEQVAVNDSQQDDNGKGENDSTAHSSKEEEKPRQQPVMGPGIMQAEERNTGAISGAVYREYSKAGNGAVVLPILVFGIVLLQTATVMSSYWLVYWQERKWPRSDGFYMGLYAVLGFSQAVAAFIMGSTFAMLTFFASQHLHRAAIHRVMHAPMSFFETTPLGRIMNRFSKDIDTIDNLLGDSLRMLAGTTSAIVGAILLISIVLPWFLIGVCFILIIYAYAATFYRASARELKRLDAVLRSSLYAHFSESLSGLATIRAYQESERFVKENERRIDIENRAYWLTVTNQRWLGIRLDFLGALLTFIVAMLTVGTRFTISPAQTGLVLSYILSVQQAFGWLVRQSAEVENNMNSVERIVHYATAIEQEPPHEIPANKPPAPWPAEGRVEMRDVVLSYRPELAPVLKGITMDVRAGEKIGIVGRTGAGKSSIMTALYRLVELTSGTIHIDGVDVSKIGLSDLRSGLAIIPQDALLFSGTLRSNLDPFNLHDDATLWDALKRSYLVETTKRDSSSHPDDAPSGTPINRFTLDTIIEDEGNNLSIGQRSLVSLARALVKNSKIIILDEATASVDYETDRNIQDTIAHEFHDRTILCIAHRLRTIISYDRICVLDAGQIAEFDTPERLFTRSDGIFRGMCDRSSITLDDIRLTRKATKDEIDV